MIFEPEQRLPVPTKDILSYIFDEPKYDRTSRIKASVYLTDLLHHAHPGNNRRWRRLHRYQPVIHAVQALAPVKTAKANFLISEPEILKPLLVAAKGNNIPQSNIWTFDVLGQEVPPGMRSWGQLLTHGEEEWMRFDDLKTSKETTAARLFSSGTTGLPKATVISHYNLVAQHEPCWEANPIPYQHLINIEKFNSTDIIMAPPMTIAIIMSPFTQKRNFLKGLKWAGCGAAPLDKDTQARFRALMAEGAPFTQGWGMTETACVGSMFLYPEHDDTGSVGRLIPNLEVELVPTYAARKRASPADHIELMTEKLTKSQIN
ncbi:hypothetical protein VTN00DRAFT_6115 [Thermoascus crustaceus]|uniref:uncharacterized protein n=1 Tax=Thermoascus crustaceus TaxID=5088 RepID=UPI003744802A